MWEYLIEQSDIELTEAGLNKFGLRGWELTSVVVENFIGIRYTYYFKRRKE